MACTETALDVRVDLTVDSTLFTKAVALKILMGGGGWGGGGGGSPFSQLWQLPRIQYGVTFSPLIWMPYSLSQFWGLHFCFSLFVFLFFNVTDSLP